MFDEGDETEISSVSKFVDDEYELCVNGYKCPLDYVNLFTPMEFEEVVQNFITYDVSGSQTIDVHEIRKILNDLGQDNSMENAQKLLRAVDEEDTGVLDFDHFCKFILMIKQGDARVAMVSELIDKLHTTPLGILEAQAKQKGLRFKFVLLEEREATGTHAAYFVFELQLSGMWHEIVHGAATSHYQLKRFQGIGKTTKDAKYDCVKGALEALSKQMPGVKFKEGEIPSEWSTWVDENLLRGVQPKKLVKILFIKGFHAYRNIAFMQRMCVLMMLDKFLSAHKLTLKNISGTNINPDLKMWVLEALGRGIDGSVMMEVLESRGMDLGKYHPHYSQKLKHNEIGVLLEQGGTQATLLDFWTACVTGQLEEVELYLESGQPVDEERVGKHDNVARTALVLAALHNQTAVMRLLLDYGADVAKLDRRMRTVLHTAAAAGKTEACKLLLSNGSRVFDSDSRGNSALHLAAQGNHLETLDLLVHHALERCRDITFGRVTCRGAMSFETLVEQIFEELPRTKLAEKDTIRFEKRWLFEACHMFLRQVDFSKKSLVPTPTQHIADDILKRFDARPESGIYVLSDLDGMVFVSTVVSASDLSDLIRYVFQQASLDHTNDMKRTPLHSACDANVVNSHDPVISLLIDKYGANVWMEDVNRKRPYDLLSHDENNPLAPSATRLREEVIFDRRQTFLTELSAKEEAERQRRVDMRRQALLDKCREIADKLSINLWHVTREASLLRKSVDVWDQYEDPDTRNFFFARQPVDELMGDRYSDYSWALPEAAKVAVHKIWAWIYQWSMRSSIIRSVAGWDVYRCIRTGAIYYHNPGADIYTISAPTETLAHIVGRKSVRVRRFGFRDEWEQLQDADQNFLYRLRHSQVYQWDRPTDAVDVGPGDLLCTAFVNNGRSTLQRYFTCEQCNRELRLRQKNDPSAPRTTTTVRMCESCATRCHSKHHGVRFMSEGRVLCLCRSLCRSICPCMARVKSRLQLSTERASKISAVENFRIRERDALCPFILAMVPRFDPDGTERRESGWMICRRAAPADPFLTYRKHLELKEHRRQARDQAKAARAQVSQYLKTSQAAGTDSDDSDSSSDKDLTRPATTASEPRQEALEDDGEEDAQLVPATDVVEPPGRASVTVPPSNVVQEEPKEEDEEDLGVLLFEEGLLGAKPLEPNVIAVIEQDFPYVPPDGLSPEWVEVYDPEEPLEPQEGSRVLFWDASPDSTLLRKFYGTLGVGVRGIYSIAPSYGGAAITLSRERFEVVNKRTFLCNTVTGEAVWTLEGLGLSIAQQAHYCRLSGEDWRHLLLSCQKRRMFENFEELEDGSSGIILYRHLDTHQEEDAALMLQKIWRQKKGLARPAAWTSFAYTFEPPEEVIAEEKTLAAWALLRRRSTVNKEVTDIAGSTWNELVDSESAEYFYWYEPENLYQWDKPRISDPTAINRGEADILDVGQDVLYQFPNKHVFEKCVVTRQRVDDQTGEVKYDIAHKFKPEITVKWVFRVLLRRAAMTPEEIELKELEHYWRGNLRRMRAAAERKNVALRIARAEAEMARRYKRAARDMNKKTLKPITQVLAGARDRRIKNEISEFEAEQERERVATHQEELKLLMQAAQEESPDMTRWEVLQLQRTLDMKISVLERLAKRDELQRERLAYVEETRAKASEIEEELKETEGPMTTPRSLSRRKVLRQLHRAMQRQKDGMIVCQWGCGDWIRVGQDQLRHQTKICFRRIVPCHLGCSVRMSEESWLLPYTAPPSPEDDLSLDSESETEPDKGETVQQHHEDHECVRRLVPCPRKCMEWCVFEELTHHMHTSCVKRPAKPLQCRLGCGQEFGGEQGLMIEAEDDRLQHEQEECMLRQLRCMWTFPDGSRCTAMMMAKDRDGHRDFHLEQTGISMFKVSGTFIYKVAPNVTKLKIQLWGAGGGSGYFYDRKAGNGGGGSFVECLVHVNPHDILEICVGSGGAAGVPGHTFQPTMELARSLSSDAPLESGFGTSAGGVPGGGQGFGEGSRWAAGGGGGYSMVSKRAIGGNQALAVAAGGGGGSSCDGLPGTDMNGPTPGTVIDKRNGGSASMWAGGEAGDSGSSYFSAWPAQPGSLWTGGSGSQFGAGGGGGYYGGGGGGTSPGVGGGGGGGSSYVFTDYMLDYVVIAGTGHLPGGLQHDIPEAAGLGEWDKPGGSSGEGGQGDMWRTRAGNAGAVRILKPGFF